MTKVKKTQPRLEIIKALLKDLRWLQSKENSVRMDDKRIQGYGIAVDAIMICLDFSKKAGFDCNTIINDLLIRFAMSETPDSKTREHYFKLWDKSEKLLRKADNERNS